MKLPKSTVFENIEIVLVRPRHGGNVGSVARAMKNMGFSKLTLVSPRQEHSSEAYKMAYGAGDILDAASIYDDFAPAVSKVRMVVGTTMRRRKGQDLPTPLSEAVPKILAHAKKQRVALVFGSERTGLTNEELDLCREWVIIPMAVDFPSLNLSQATVVVLYELFKGLSSDVVETPTRLLAQSSEMERFFGDMEGLLTEIDFVKGVQGRHILSSLRRIIHRSGLNSREVRILRATPNTTAPPTLAGQRPQWRVF